MSTRTASTSRATKRRSLSEQAAAEVVQLRQRLSEMASNQDFLLESMAELEQQLAVDDIGYRRLGLDLATQFSKQNIDRLADLARTMYIKNPIIGRGVEVKTFYVFGQGVTISARNPDVNALIQAFLDDPKNRAELTSHQAMLAKEVDLECDGNIFLVLFTSPVTGRVWTRSAPPAQITRIIANPEDAKEPWFYHRCWTEQRLDVTTGLVEEVKREAYYPDWRYRPRNQPKRIGSVEVCWDAPIYHAKAGAFGDWQFGVCEFFAAIDWARAYNKFLEDWASITAALATFAFKAKVDGGGRAVAGIKGKLESSLTRSGTGGETNPRPAAGSVAVEGKGMTLEPFRTAGATTSMEDGRRLLLMAIAAFGLPETFFGDASVGTVATAQSLDRPTELMMANRQLFWQAVFADILSYVLYAATQALQPGPLAAAVAKLADEDVDEDGETVITWAIDDETKQPADRIDIVFPPVVEIDTKARIEALTGGASYVPDPRLIARLILTAWGVDNIDELLLAMFPEDEAGAGGASSPADPAGDDPEKDEEDIEGDDQADAEDQLDKGIEALREIALSIQRSLRVMEADRVAV